MSRARLAARSALLRWSAAMISILRPSTSPPKSSAAILAAVSEPGPVMSAYSPDISSRPPSLSGGLSCAIAVVAASTSIDASTPWNTRFIMDLPSERAASSAAFILRCGDHAACARERQAASKPRRMLVFPLSGMDRPVQKCPMLSRALRFELRRLAIAAIALCGLLPAQAIAGGGARPPQGEGRVTQVIDARTLRLDDGREVILAGIEPIAPDEADDAGKTKAS